MKYEIKRNPNAIFVLLIACLLLLASTSQADAQYYNSFSSMLDKSSMWRNNFYNDVIRANSGSFGQVGSAPTVSNELIQNLCKPFPCAGPKPSIMESQPAPSYPQAPVYSSPPAPTYPQAPAYTPPPAPRQYPITATDFRPAGGRIVPDEMSRMAQGTAEEKETVRTLSNQFLDALEREGRKNNMANSFAFLTSISMQIILNRDLTEAEEEQLISGFNNSLGASPQFASMSARDKQVLYETAIICGGMIAFLHEQGKLNKDAKMQSDGRTMAKAVLVSLFGIRIE